MTGASAAQARAGSSTAREDLSPILVDAKDAAALLGISRAHLHNLRSSGRIPKPERLGRAVRWSVEELLAWSRAGCPARDRWETLRESSR